MIYVLLEGALTALAPVLRCGQARRSSKSTLIPCGRAQATNFASPFSIGGGAGVLTSEAPARSRRHRRNSQLGVKSCNRTQTLQEGTKKLSKPSPPHPYHHETILQLDRDMGLGKIGRTRARPHSMESGAAAYRRVEVPEHANPRTANVRHNVVALIVVAITAVVYVVGWIRTSWGP